MVAAPYLLSSLYQNRRQGRKLLGRNKRSILFCRSWNDGKTCFTTSTAQGSRTWSYSATSATALADTSSRCGTGTAAKSSPSSRCQCCEPFFRLTSWGVGPLRCHDTQHNGIQHNDSLHNDTQHNAIQNNESA